MASTDEKKRISLKVNVEYVTHNIVRSADEMDDYEPPKSAKPQITEITLVENAAWVTARSFLNRQFKAGTFVVMYIDLGDQRVFDIERKNDHLITAEQLRQIQINRLNMRVTLISVGDYNHCLMNGSMHYPS